MIDILISIIVFCIVGGLLYYLVTLLPIPAPFSTIIQVAMILILILVLLNVTGLMGGGWRLSRP